MKRILCSLLLATLPFGSVLADEPKEKNAKVTLVYQHELPDVPGKSVKGVLDEHGPGGYSPGHTHPKSAFIYANFLQVRRREPFNSGQESRHWTPDDVCVPGERRSRRLDHVRRACRGSVSTCCLLRRSHSERRETLRI